MVFIVSSNQLKTLLELLVSQLDKVTELSSEINEPNNSREVSLLEEVVSQLAQKEGNSLRQTNQSNSLKLSPENILIILGLLNGTLSFSSILIGINQVVQVRIDGSLKT